jgi:prophage regulatory protein
MRFQASQAGALSLEPQLTNQSTQIAAPKSTSGQQFNSQQHATASQWDGAVTITQACRSPKNPRSILPCSRQTAYAWIEAGILPKPIKFGPRMTGWSVQVLRDWLASQQSK